MPRVLVVATGRKTRGGITSVIKAHETGEQWKKYHCIWIQTHRDSNSIVKLWYFATSIVEFIILLPFCDIVHFHFSNSITARRKRILMPIAKFFGKKIIAHFHSFAVENSIKGPYREKYTYLFPNADLIIVLSDYWKKVLMQELSIEEKKIKILHNPCPIVAPSHKDVSRNCSKEFLYAGTITHRKGYDDMIRAFAKIAPNHRDWKIVFAGNGEIEKGRVLASELGIIDQVVFLGWISGSEKEIAFSHATIFCLPSYAEGFPMSVLDAWAYGLPVITTPVGGIPDIAIDGRNMLLFEPGDINALSMQMEKLICNETLRNTLSTESKLLAHTTFNVLRINQQLGDIYEELLNI